MQDAELHKQRQLAPKPNISSRGTSSETVRLGTDGFETPPEQRLIAASSLLEKKDWAAFGELLERYRPMLREMAQQMEDRRLTAKIDHSDLVQETYRDALRGFSRLRAKNSAQFFVWMKTLLANNIRTAHRRFVKSQKRSVACEQSLNDNSALQAGLSDQRMPTQDDLIASEQLQKLMNALSKLPPPLQAILKWRYEDEMTLRQIAERVDRSESAVRMLIIRCLESLRLMVYDEDEELKPKTRP